MLSERVGERECCLMRMIEHFGEHYNVQEMPFGRIYRWSAEQVVFECKCGKKITLKRAEIIGSDVSSCECCKDNTARIREELIFQLLDEEEEYEAHHHPWRYDTREQAKQHLRDEVAYPKDSSWRYNDVTSGLMTEE
jgi:hypothetical protein